MPNLEHLHADERSRFGNLDLASDAAGLVGFLKDIGVDQFTQGYYRASRELLGVHQGNSLLEVGCGTLPDRAELCVALGSEGRLVAADRSRIAIGAFRDGGEIVKSTANAPRIFPIQEDACALAHADQVFDLSRASRVFQHIPNPKGALQELCRVTKDRICVIDPDWDTFTIVGPDEEVATLVEERMAAIIQNRSLGRELAGLMKDIGLANVVEEVWVRQVRDFEQADRFYQFRTRIDELVEQRKLRASSGRDWLEQCSWLSAQGGFLMSLTIYVVAGEKANIAESEL